MKNKSPAGAGVEGLRVEYRTFKELKRYERNPKKHDLVSLQSAIERFGYVSPIIVNETTNEMLVGHGRVDVLKERFDLGLPPPRRIKLAQNGDWLIPVVIVSLPAEEHGAYVIADNRLVETGGWDDEQLAALLKEIDSGPGIEGLGFDIRQLEKIIHENEINNPVPGMDLQPYEHWDYVVLMFQDARDWMQAVQLFGLKEVRASNSPKNDRAGIGRVIDGKKLLELIKGHPVKGKKQAPPHP